MSEANLLAFLRKLGDEPELLDELKVQGKDEVVKAAAELGLPFEPAEFDRLIWDLEGRLAEYRGEGFDGHFPFWRTMWGRYYLEALAVDLVPSLIETHLTPATSETPPSESRPSERRVGH